MASFLIPDDLYLACKAHLTGDVEQVGFFLAEWSDSGQFNMREWRPLAPESLDAQERYYLELSERARADVIRWAWEAELCLVEAHLHSGWPVAAFSFSDIHGFHEWVPHLWWRLAGRPYAAMVVAGDTYDALAWVTGPRAPEQVQRIHLTGGNILNATGATLRSPCLSPGDRHV
jgi:hypothetical protein